MKKIFFFKEGVKFRLNKSDKLKNWFLKVVRKEGYSIENINFVFCSDKYLRKINKDYLQHDFFTDVVTFDNSIEDRKITGDIYISIQSVKSNAARFNVSFDDELHRVMVHGVLHLAGYNDKNEKDQLAMRKREDFWLAAFERSTK